MFSFVGKVIFYIVRWVFMKMLGSIVIMALIYGGFYLYMNADPERKASFDKKQEAAIQMLGNVGGLIDQLAESADENGQVSIAGMSFDVETLEAITSFLPEGSIDPSSVPRELAPMDELMKNLPGYEINREKFTVEQAGENGENLVKELTGLLHHSNRDVRQAARDSLELMDSSAARNALKVNDYE